MNDIVVCPEPLAAEAGLEIYEKGGNAVDAAVATAFAQGVVNPLLCGIGGNGCINIYDAERDVNEMVYFRCPAGSKAEPDVFADKAKQRSETVGRYEVEGYINQIGYQSICIPTFVSGVAAAHQRYGRLTWSEVLDPAIGYAREGFEVYPYLHRFWRGDSPFREIDPIERLKTTPGSEAIFLREGRVYEVGEWFTQPDLAWTLERLAHEGAKAFYHGDIAEKIVADIEAHGGFVTREDMRTYRPEIIRPVRGRYRGYVASADPPPSSGIQVVTTLRVLDGLELDELAHGSVEYVDLLARVLQSTFQDRARYYADPKFEDVPIATLVSEEHARELRTAVLDRDGLGPALPVDGRGGTTHLTTADRQGSVATFTHSIGSISGVVTEGLGFMYNNMMGPFNPHPGHHDSIAPGKIPVLGGGPTILFAEDGQPILAAGSPAGSRGTAGIIQSIVNAVDHNMSAEAAVTVPRFHSEEREVVFLEEDHPQELEDGLRDMGYQTQRTNYMGRVQLVVRDPESSEWTGGSDPRGGRGLAVLSS